jgi:hypothetical protein
VSIAKNYISEQHIAELNRIISAYLDLAENRALRQIIMTMNDWIVFLHSFLNLSNYPILQHLGQISAMEAKIKAETEFDKYRVVQDQNYESDFDKLLNQLNVGGENE